MTRTALIAALHIGCGGDSGSGADAATGDATQAKVIALSSCPSFVAATIEDSASAFVPNAVTISVNSVVKFVITAEHTVIPNTLMTTDPALMVGRGQTKCFEFKQPGTYAFLCGVHSFPGTITVQ